MTETVTPEAQTSSVARKDIHQQVTDTIINQLENGIIPWQQSWIDNSLNFGKLPKNGVTGKFYRGVNILLLWGSSLDKKYPSNEWASFKQWQQKKEPIRKGEKGTFIVYTDTFEKEVDGELKKIPFLKYSVVFNRCQLANYIAPEEPETKTVVVEKIEVAEDFIANTFAQIEHREGGACYSPSLDKIFMPSMESFIETAQCTPSENYYSTLFHEMTHWTGHPKRLDRQIKNKFGNHAYAEEELIAELGSAFLGAEFNITTPEKADHSGYIANWLKVLKDNKHFIISAASEASKAVEFMRGLQPLKLEV